ncbi:hypothetical protein V8E55_001299, partial [Tylopilus felleus]
DGKVLLVLPDSYHAHLQRFVWREEAIRLVLAHEEELELSEDFVDNITMFMWYMDNVFKRMMIESGPKVKKAESSYHSPTFDNYLLVEHCVRRHEPVNVRAWRRTTDVPFEDFNVHECDWDAYEETLGGIWSGARMQYVMTKESMTLMLATRLLEQCTTFYEPPVGMDPDFGYTYMEHIENRSDDEEDRPGPSTKAGKGEDKAKTSDVGIGDEMDVDDDKGEGRVTKEKAMVTGKGKEKEGKEKEKDKHKHK